MPAPVSIRSLKLRRLLGRKPVFFCWRRDDCADIAGRIYDRLRTDLGKRGVIRDLDSIPLGADFPTYIKAAIPCCRAVVAVIGPQWFRFPGGTGPGLNALDDYVRLEIATALARGVRIIPVLVGGTPAPQERYLPAELRGLAHRHGLRVRNDPDFHGDVDRLVAQL